MTTLASPPLYPFRLINIRRFALEEKNKLVILGAGVRLRASIVHNTSMVQLHSVYKTERDFPVGSFQTP